MYSRISFIIVFLSLFISCKNVKDNQEISKLSTEEISEACKEAYIFAYPLVVNYSQMYKMCIDTTANEYIGHLGTLGHKPFYTPQNTEVVTPNNNVLLSWAWMDLYEEPYVITVPPTEENRYFTIQIDDLWGHVLDNIGIIKYGNEGGDYLLASEKWNGTLPSGIKSIIKSETDLTGIFIRTGVISDGDSLVSKIQKSFQLQPLSQYLKAKTSFNERKINWLKWEDKDLETPMFFNHVKAMMNHITEKQEDKRMLDICRTLGLVDNGTFNANALTDEQSSAVQQGIDAACKYLEESSLKAKDAFAFFGDRSKMGTDYLNRSLGVKMGHWGNTKEQAAYYAIQYDAQGSLLKGEGNSYILHFEKEDIPETKFFWSVTMYNLPQRLLVDNPIDRYNIGSNSKSLKYNKDGSIDIYVSYNPPAEGRISNWLPAPEGQFYLVLRLYGPEGKNADGYYKVPSLKKIN